MDTSKPNISSLRQRMVEDMRMRKLAPKTQAAYIRAVRKFAKCLGRSPDTATDEDLRCFQLHLVDQGASPITLNATIVGLNFLFEVSLGRPELMAKMQSVRMPHKLPVILNKDEVTRLIACVGHIKHQTALSLAYGTGLRVGEVVALKVGDINSKRMTRVEQGKGRKDRYVMLSPVLLERLRVWWRRSTDEMVPTPPSEATVPSNRWADTPTPMPPWTTGSSVRARNCQAFSPPRGSHRADSAETWLVDSGGERAVADMSADRASNRLKGNGAA